MSNGSDNYDEYERELYDEIQYWKDETLHMSSIRRAIAHPSYLRIIALAQYLPKFTVEQALFRELQTEPMLHWFPALTALTNADPTEPEDDFDEAMEAWLAWGREKGIIE